MRKLKEVLRLQSLGLSQHQIARSCSISQSTVHEYLSAAHAAGVKWPLAEDWDDRQIEQALFPRRIAREACGLRRKRRDQHNKQPAAQPLAHARGSVTHGIY